MSQQPPPVPVALKKSKRWMWIGIGAIAVSGLAVVGLFVAGFLIGLNGLNATIYPASEAEAGMVETALDRFELDAGEELEFLFKLPIIPFAESGCAITDLRVVSWDGGDFGGYEVEQLRFDQVASVSLDLDEDELGGRNLFFQGPGENRIFMFLSEDDAMNQRVADWVRERLPEGARVW